MSVLTKVFVVLLAVLSIALSMLVVAAFAQQENWRASAQEWASDAAAAQAKASTISQAASIEQQRLLDKQLADRARIGELESQVLALQGQIAETDRQLAEARSGLTIEQGTVSKLTEQNALLQASLNREEQLATSLAQRNAELERFNIDLNDRVKELTVNLSMAQSQIRALQQQIASMEGGTTRTAAATTPATAGTTLVEPRVPTVKPETIAAMQTPIRGQVTGVRGNVVSISVGSADGVAHGMIFLIYRREASGPQYLGTMRVTRVDANESAGIIEQAEGDILAGDAVRDEASFAMRG